MYTYTCTYAYTHIAIHPPSEPIQFMTDYFAKRPEAVQVPRREYESPCPPPPLLLEGGGNNTAILHTKSCQTKNL